MNRSPWHPSTAACISALAALVVWPLVSVAAGETWWSFKPLATVEPPSSAGLPQAWGENPIDRFVFARLAANGLDPNGPADRLTYIRRVTFDLIGLPPTPEEVDAFVGDKEPGAYERLVDRLLASPHYGEQWGRHWLDVVRFGESNGFERNVLINTLWPFRDYVIRSFNEDKPFDQFIVEHLAGDVVGGDDAGRAIGTAFLVCGPYDNVGNQDAAAAAQIRADTIDEMIRATSEAMLGLTIGCARCHDHKFDPVSTRDYYGLYATFAGTFHGERPMPVLKPKPAPQGKRPAVNARQNTEKFAPVEARYVRFTVTKTNKYEPCLDELEVYETGTSKNVARGAAATSSGDYQGNPKHQLVHINDGKYGNPRSWISNTRGTGWVELALPEPVTIDRIVWGRDRQGRYDDRLAIEYRIEVAAERGQWRTVASSADRTPFSTQPANKWWAGQFRPAPGPFHVFRRGSPQQKGEAVTPASMPALSQAAKGYTLDGKTPEAQRRLALAKWIVADDNPLTPRVLVNRLWHYHFGVGIVDTPSDFGKMGGRPTHPALLDWLAARVRADGWRLKPLHRLIVLSQTYRQSSAYRAEAAKKDGAARLLWRYPPRRLTGEQVRDAMLVAAGKLDTRMGGPGFRLYEYQQDNVATYVPLATHPPSTYRRAVYHQNARAQHVDVLTDFDCPDPAMADPRRTSTTTPMQALTLMNHAFAADMAEALADRLRREVNFGPPSQVGRAFMVAFARPPTAEETAAAVRLVEEHGLRALCRALFNANEFVYVD